MQELTKPRRRISTAAIAALRAAKSDGGQLSDHPVLVESTLLSATRFGQRVSPPTAVAATRDRAKWADTIQALVRSGFAIESGVLGVVFTAQGVAEGERLRSLKSGREPLFPPEMMASARARVRA